MRVSQDELEGRPVAYDEGTKISSRRRTAPTGGGITVQYINPEEPGLTGEGL